jgi:hypothetical protein
LTESHRKLAIVWFTVAHGIEMVLAHQANINARSQAGGLLANIVTVSAIPWAMSPIPCPSHTDASELEDVIYYFWSQILHRGARNSSDHLFHLDHHHPSNDMACKPTM